MQPQTFVFFGIVGSGKGTQVKLLQEYLKNKGGKEAVYIGTGEIFRKILESPGDDPNTKFVKEIVNSGKLIPDGRTNEIVQESLRTKFSPDRHLIFDGYPRTVPQSQEFENMMKSYGCENVKIIYIELSEEEALKRNLLRGRHDDTPEGLAKRFEEYRNNVIPAMNFFKGKAGYEIFTINGEQSIEAVHQDIIKALNI